MNTYDTFNFGDLKYLKQILMGIKKKDPIPKGTIPLSYLITFNMIAYLRSLEQNWFNYVLQVMFVFAWAFCLRCSEYTKTKDWDAPLWSSIKFFKNSDGVLCLSYKLDRRKNKVHEEVEPIVIPCTCSDFGLCGYHTILEYCDTCEKIGYNSPYLFAYEYGNSMKPFSAATFRNGLKKVLKYLFKGGFDHTIHRAHGFRYGGITDLGTLGIPHDLIRRISGHAPESKVLLHYLKLAPEAVATLIKTNKDKETWKSLLKKLKSLKI